MSKPFEVIWVAWQWIRALVVERWTSHHHSFLGGLPVTDGLTLFALYDHLIAVANEHPEPVAANV